MERKVRLEVVDSGLNDNISDQSYNISWEDINYAIRELSEGDNNDAIRSWVARNAHDIRTHDAWRGHHMKGDDEYWRLGQQTVTNQVVSLMNTLSHGRVYRQDAPTESLSSVVIRMSDLLLIRPYEAGLNGIRYHRGIPSEKGEVDPLPILLERLSA